jgi:very-short-patch-repair endonuclease
MLWIVVGIVAVIALVLLKALAALRKRDTRKGLAVVAKPLLSRPEQGLYSRLVRAFPGHVVMAQVALSQLLVVTQATANGTRQSAFNRFRQLVADFVICRPDFTALAVIELDDRTHARPVQRERDQRKDEFLRAAGIKVVRISVARLPSDEELRELTGMGAAATIESRVTRVSAS